MQDAIVKATSMIASWRALVVSVATGFFGSGGFLLSKKIRSGLNGDEVLIPGMLRNPTVKENT